MNTKNTGPRSPPQYVLSLQIPSRSHTLDPDQACNMYRKDTGTPWTEDEIMKYAKELRAELDRLSPLDNTQSSSSGFLSCCFRKGKHRQRPKLEVRASEVEMYDEEDQKVQAPPQLIDIEVGGQPMTVSMPIPEDGALVTNGMNRRISLSFNDRLVRTPIHGGNLETKDLNSGILETTNAFLELLQLDTMSKHLQEMRDRRMFLERAKNDEDLPEEERQIAAWITDTYLSKSPTSHYPQTILENIIKNQSEKMEQHDVNISEHIEIERTKSEDLANKEIVAIIRLTDNSILKDHSERTIEMLSNTGDWNFPVFEFVRICGNSSLALLMLTICKSQSYLSTLNVPSLSLMMFMKAVDMNYKDNPYHNHIHAADVLLNLHYFMKSGLFNNNIDELDAFAILVSACVHDVGHPGYTNTFAINTESALAVTYNDQSVLENMHICLAWNLLNKSQCNILCNFDQSKRKRFRKVLVDSVLATDMSQHSLHSETLEKLVEEYGDIDFIDAEDRASYKFANEFLPIALHTADLGNLCKEIAFYSEWVERLMNEFFKQGDQERELGLPISFLCDRFKVNIHAGQVGFINFVVRPWFTKFGMLLKEDSHNKLWLENLNENLKYMQDGANITKKAQEEIQKKNTLDDNIAPAPNTASVMAIDQGIEVVLEEEEDEPTTLVMVTPPDSETPSKPQAGQKVEDPKKPVIYAIGDEENPSYSRSRMSKSYSIVGLTFPEMKTKLLEYAENER